MAFKTGFSGKSSGLYIGQVPAGQYKNHISIQRWGDRVKVRLLGYHPKEKSILPDDDLPWALVARPTSHGSLNKTSIGLSGGEWVLCSFSPLEDDGELIILAVLGRTDPRYEQETTEEGGGTTAFRKTLNYSGPIQPADFNMRGGQGATQGNNLNENRPPITDLFNNIA
jgi:hypothetical protein